MGTIKNAVYKVDNGTDFDEIHFKTKAEQVICSNGKTAEAQLAEKVNKTYTIYSPTLINGWDNLWADYETIKYWKDDLNIVHVQGAVKNGSSATVFQLPVGFRPGGHLIINVVTGTFGNWRTTQCVLTASSGVVEVVGYSTACILDFSFLAGK